MNLTGLPPYQKGAKRKKRTLPPTKAQSERWDKIAKLGCIIEGCPRDPSIHHCLTGGGGRKDHDKVLGLCHYHHQGEQGIHTLSRKVWEPIYGAEEDLMQKLSQLLDA